MTNYVDLLVQEEGLIPLGIVPLFYSADYLRFQKWIAEGKHGDLRYLEQNEECRQEPEKLLAGSKSCLVVALAYDQGDAWPLTESEAPRIAQYARFKDYHHLLRDKAEAVVAKLKRQSDCSQDSFRVVVDTAPILERALAAQTREGFIGKNTCFIHPKHGSFLLLAEILTTHYFKPDIPARESLCGSCTLCQVECPTGALDEDYVIDSKRCLSYWTIEQRGPIPEVYWPHLAKYYFGCDICQLVCPFNQEATENKLPTQIPIRAYPSLYEVATMDQKNYERFFGGSPLTRAKRNGLRRNALIAMTVTSDVRLQDALEIARIDRGSPIDETVSQIETYLQVGIAQAVQKESGVFLPI